MAVMGAMAGLLMLAGLYLVGSGLRGVEVVERVKKEKPVAAKRVEAAATPRELAQRAAIAVVLLGVFWWSTGWPMAGASAAAISLVVPKLAHAQREREAQLGRSEDLARWCEMVRDSVRAGTSLKAAFDATAQPNLVGVTIRVPVRLLSDRCDEIPVSAALRMFADDVADPICDQVVLSLVMVEEQGGKDLVPVLTEVVDSVRRRAAMRRRVETGRARTYAATRAMVGMTILLAVLMTVFATDFMSPFDGVFGQVWMGVVGAAFTGAVWAMVPLSKPEPEPRLLASMSQGVVV